MIKNRMNGGIIILGVLLLIVAACSKKVTYKPSEEMIKTRVATEKLMELKGFYQNKDIQGILSVISQRFKGLEVLKGSIQKDFSYYDDMALEFTNKLVRMEKDTIMLTVYWEGRWREKVTANVFNDKGTAVFVFKDEERLLITKIEGDNPIGITASR
ncbi:MAG: hypothetical protein AB1488_07170 [Nitrospirota bacterium]